MFSQHSHYDIINLLVRICLKASNCFHSGNLKLNVTSEGWSTSSQLWGKANPPLFLFLTTMWTMICKIIIIFYLKRFKMNDWKSSMFSDVMHYRRQGSVSRRFLHHCVLPFFLHLKIYLFIIWSSEIHKDIQVMKKLICCSQSDVHSCSIFSFPEETPTGRVSLDGRLDPQGANKYLSAHFFLDIFLVLCRMRYQLPASHLSSVFVLQMNWAMKLIMPENAHSWI